MEYFMTSRSRALLGAVTAVLLLALSACGSSSSPSSTPTTQTPTKIAIKITADSVDPNAAEVKVGLNQPVVLQITSTVAGELHVHSTPEQHVEFPVGYTEKTLTFDKPGVIDIEDHALEKLIVQVEVS
jgi:hypothetical protein